MNRYTPSLGHCSNPWLHMLLEIFDEDTSSTLDVVSFWNIDARQLPGPVLPGVNFSQAAASADGALSVRWPGNQLEPQIDEGCVHVCGAWCECVLIHDFIITSRSRGSVSVLLVTQATTSSVTSRPTRLRFSSEAKQEAVIECMREHIRVWVCTAPVCVAFRLYSYACVSIFKRLGCVLRPVGAATPWPV